ncbi:hypothetical protein [Kocuria kalidii]|uniref:hypothetical protein n=1 Tax=Kocuria kalidii TaxID=3376283 RepID=UPI0037943EBC
MEQRPAAHGGQHETSRTLSASARARLAAALREDRTGARPGPFVGTPAEDGPAPPRLPPEDGLEPVHRLGGSSWLVREVRSGEQFVLRACPAEPGPQRDRSWRAVRSLAVALAGREDPCVVAVRGLLGPVEAPVGLVEDFLAGGSLAERLSGRDRLDPVAVASVLRDAATGLAALHALGRCHGGLTARQILFRTPERQEGHGTPEGAAAAGAAAVRAGTTAGRPEDDVRDLAVVGWAALTGRSPSDDAHRVPLAVLRPDAPSGLVRAVEASLDADPSARPTARELADRLASPHEPGPGAGAAPTTRPARRPGRGGGSTPTTDPSRSATGRRLLLGGGLALVLASGAAVLLGQQDSSPRPSPAVTARATVTAALPVTSEPSGPAAHGGARPDATPPATAADPRRAVRELVARRGAALRTGDARLLEEVYAPGADAAAADREAIAHADGAGDGVFDELLLEVESVRDPPPGTAAGSSEPGTVALLAEVRVDGYRGEPDGAPSVVPSGRGWLQTVVVTLVDGERGWRLARVEPAAGAPPRTGADPAREDPRG